MTKHKASYMLNIETLSDDSTSKQFLTINRRRKSVHAELKVFSMNDGEDYIIYIPAINMSAYGRTQKEASEMLHESINDFFNKLVNSKLDLIKSELRKYGWIKSIFNKQFYNTSYIDKLGVLKNFDMPKDTPIEEKMIQVA